MLPEASTMSTTKIPSGVISGYWSYDESAVPSLCTSRKQYDVAPDAPLSINEKSKSPSLPSAMPVLTVAGFASLYDSVVFVCPEWDGSFAFVVTVALSAGVPLSLKAMRVELVTSV